MAYQLKIIKNGRYYKVLKRNKKGWTFINKRFKTYAQAKHYKYKYYKNT